MKKLETLALVGLLMGVLLVYPALAQTTTVSIEDIQVGPGGSATVPIYIYNVTDPDGVGTVQLDLAYDSSVVEITSTDDSNTDFDFVTLNINNTIGKFTVGGSVIGLDGPTGDVRIIDVTFSAIGSVGEGCPLDITVIVLKDTTAEQNDIPHEVDDGTFTILEEAEPIVADPAAEPLVIPDDTDNDPGWGELAELMVNATDESGIATVTIDLADLGWGTKTMLNIGNYTKDTTLWLQFNYSTNATVGTTSWNGAEYMPFCLPVNATDIHGNSNTSLCISLTVMTNGDVNEDGTLNFGDVTYLANNVVGTTGYESMEDSVAEVNGDTLVNFGDVTYLANHVVGTAGYELLR